MASTYLTITPSSGSGRTKWTWSAWIKRTALANQNLWGVNVNSSSYAFIGFRSDKLRVQETYNGSETMELRTTRVFRDTNAWYHIVVAQDTTQSTASERLKIYINGVEETAFDVSNYPASQNYTPYFLNTYTHVLGRDIVNNVNNFDGCMSHVHVTDGYVYDASAFGQYDANGVWKIKTSPSVTYGTNGFFILKDGNSVTDQSGNGNNWTVAGGTLTNTEDNPSNVFATFNPLFNYNAQATFSNGNLQVSTSNSATNLTPLVSTLGMSSGKYYAEIKYSATTDPGNFARIGVCSKVADRGTNVPLQNDVDDHGYQGSDGNYLNNTNSTSYGATYTTGDIIGVALDLDNGYIYFHKNGTYQNSGDPTSGATGTGGKSVSIGKDYFFAVADIDYLDSYTFQANFGNGYFGTTAVASAGTNASGIGIFEYDVPTGYTALSTKGLNL